jgi:putative hydrolase of the HAD superfamily
VKERDDVRAVFFDAGYTLLCMDPPQETIFLRVCTALGIAVDRSKLPIAMDRANLMFAPKQERPHHTPFSQARVDRFWTAYHRELLSHCAIHPVSEDIAASVYRGFSQAIGWRIYDEVRPLLRALQDRRIALGVISNWTGDLEDVLRRTGLHAHFDIILDSARFGHEKPAPEIFAEALRAVGVQASCAMHVGDSIDHDVDGARNAGLRAILLDRRGKHADFAAAPRVGRLDEILQFC